MSIFSPEDFSRRPRREANVDHSKFPATNQTQAQNEDDANNGPTPTALLPPGSVLDDSPTLPRSVGSTPRQHLPEGFSSVAQQQRQRHLKAVPGPRTSIDTFGRAEETQRQGSTSAPAPAPAPASVPTSSASAPTTQAPPNPGPLSPSMFRQFTNTSSRETVPSPPPSSKPSYATFKEEAQEYWAQKLSSRQGELASGASTTPTAVQMALSQSYGGSIDGVFAPFPTSPNTSPVTSSSNSFLHRRQQQQQQQHTQSGTASWPSSLHRSSVDGGNETSRDSRDSRDGGSSIHSSDMSKCSDSRPLLKRGKAGEPAGKGARGAAPSAVTFQPLPSTLNELTLEERQAMRRRNSKLVKLLGDEVLELQREGATPSTLKRRSNATSSAAPSSKANLPLRNPKSHHKSAESISAAATAVPSLWSLDRHSSRPATATGSEPRVPAFHRTQSERTAKQDPVDTLVIEFDRADVESVFEDDPYRERRRTTSDNARQSQGTRTLTSLPDNLTPKAAAMLGVSGTSQSSQPKRHSQSLTPLPPNVNAKAAVMLGISPPASASTTASFGIPEEGDESSSNISGSDDGHCKENRDGGRDARHASSSSLDDLLARVSEEVPQALRPRLSINRGPSSTSSHGGASHAGHAARDADEDIIEVNVPSESEDHIDDEDEEQEVMYTADERESDDEDDEVDDEGSGARAAAAGASDDDLTPDFISDTSDTSSDFVSSSMFSKSVVDDLPTISTELSDQCSRPASRAGTGTSATTGSSSDRDRQERRRRVEKMSRWLGSVVPAHIIAPGPSNDRPAYRSNELPGKKPSQSHSRTSSTGGGHSHSANGPREQQQRFDHASSRQSVVDSSMNVGLGIAAAPTSPAAATMPHKSTSSRSSKPLASSKKTRDTGMRSADAAVSSKNSSNSSSSTIGSTSIATAKKKAPKPPVTSSSSSSKSKKPSTSSSPPPSSSTTKQEKHRSRGKGGVRAAHLSSII